MSASIPSSYLPEVSTPERDPDTSTEDTPPTLASKIVIENVVLRDREGNQINGTIEEGAVFTADIIYADMGLPSLSYLFRGSSIVTYLADSEGFVPEGNNQGSVSTLASSNGYPRFQARFPNITYKGEGNTLNFIVYYRIDGERIEGSGAARIHQVDDGEDDTAPLTPYIIVSEYGYEEDFIEAGQSFTLDLTYTNTSADTDLENVIMTVTMDPKNLSIASASNTFFVDSLGAKGSRSAQVELQAKPAAEVGSHEVTIKFDYEYLVNKEWVQGSKEETIAVPVSQIDRFEVDDITEKSEAGTVDEEAYVTLNFINRGESTTKNISASVTGNLEVIAPNTHFGHLESGKTDSMDVTFIPQEPGEFFGEVVVVYEDYNNNQKEIRLPFSLYVDEPWVPDYGQEEYPDLEIVEDSGPSTVLAAVLCSLGGLLVAAPIALYLMKRVKLRGGDDFDEDF